MPQLASIPSFGPKAELFDVEGIPVSLNPDAPGVPFSMAWDTDPPRVFDPASARRNGAPLLGPERVAHFIRLIESARASSGHVAGSRQVGDSSAGRAAG